MKTNLLIRRMSAAAIFLLLVTALAAQTKKYGLALSESFEDGMPEKWTMEHVRGNHSWSVEKGGSFPDGEASGPGRIALRNGTNRTIGYITRLVTPVMNLDTIYDPILTFAYATDKWAGDFDTLRIFYRTSAEMEWVEYTDHPLDRYRSGWTRDTLKLNAPSGTYQLAFQGSDNMGRGIALDDIQVRSTPNCQQPYGIGTSALANDSAVLFWNAMFDALEFHVKVSRKALAPEELNDAVSIADVLDTVVPSSVRSLTLRGLKAGTEYYVYVLSKCREENSEWSAQQSFRTTNLMDVPYCQGFNLDYIPGTVTTVAAVDWSHYTDAQYVSPFINTATEDMELHEYSRDASRALFFADNNSEDRSLDPGSYAYAVLPELRAGYTVSDLQVSFWGGYDECAGRTSGDVKKGRLIIGVMSSPNDKSTFVPIDTAVPTRHNTIEEFIIPLDKYNGDGRFIALMSEFDEYNNFYLDDVRVEPIPPCAKAQDVKYGLPSATELSLKWRGGTEGEVLVTKTEMNPEEITDATQGEVRQKVTSNPATITGLSPWQTGYVYVRNKCGDEWGAWSNPIFFRMPERITALPDTMDFEDDESTWYRPSIDDGGGINDNNELCRGVLDIIDIDGGYIVYPVVSEIEYAKRLRKDSYNVLWFNNDVAGQVITAIFPYVDMDLRRMRISFYTRYYADYTSRAGFVIGVMTDATDLSTFVPVDTVEGAGPVWKRHTVSFDKYEGEGHLVAFMSVNDGGVYCDKSPTWTTYNGLYVDDLVFEEIPECREPDNVEVEQADAEVTLKWEGYGQKEWHVRLMTESVPVDSLYSETYKNYAKDTVVKENPTVTLRVEPDGTDYWYSVRALCDGTESAWTHPLGFVSKCLEANPLPYYMDFDGYEMGSTINGFAIPCWYTEQHSLTSGGGGHYTTSYYPNIIENGYKTGNGRLQLYESSSVEANYVALPLLAEEDMSKLTLCMKMQSGYENSRLLVGFMDDPYDITTFDTLTFVYNTETDKEDVIYVNLAGKTKYGKHIALLVDENAGSNVSQFYIDSLVVDYMPKCGMVQYPKCISVTDTEAELTWNKAGSESAWDVVVTDAIVGRDVLDAATDASALPEHVILKFTGIRDNPLTATGLQPNSSYYFYVRADCGADGYGAWSAPSPLFSTACLAMVPGDASLQTFEEENPLNCWMLGSADGKNLPAIMTKTSPTSSNYAHSGTKSLKFYNTPTQSIYAIAPIVDVDHVNKLEVSFWASGTRTWAERSGYTSLLQVGVLTSVNDLASFEKIGEITGYVDGQPYTVSLDEYEMDYQENVGRYIMFLSSDCPENNGIMIDDVRFDLIAECPAPVDLTASNVTDNSASIKWRSRAEGQEYEIKWAVRQLSQEELDGTTPVENVTVGSSTSKEENAELTGLDGSTRYYVYVRANRGGEKSVWSAPVRLYTECRPSYPIPYSVDFEPYAEKFDTTSIREQTGCLPDCWTAYYTNYTSLSYPKLDEDAGEAESWSLYVYASSSNQAYAALPKLESDAASHVLAFSAKGNTDNTQRSVIVGMSSDVSSESATVNTFVPLDTFLFNGDSYMRYFIPLKSPDGHIVFTTSYNHNLTSKGEVTAGGYYLDNVEVYETPSCPRPEYLEVTYYDESTVKLSFMEMGEAEQWEVRWTEAGGDVESASVAVCDSVTPVVANLKPLTTYDFYVRANCSAEDHSVWNGPLTCTTMAVPVKEFPYDMDFGEDKTDFSNWVLVQEGCTDKWYRGKGYDHPAGEATEQLFISCDGGLTATYDKLNSTKSYSWAYRRMRLDPGRYTFEFDWACDGYSSSNYLKAGLLPVDAEFDPTSDKVKQSDGLTDNLDYDNDLTDWISLEDTLKSNGDPVGRLYDAGADWRHSETVVMVTDETAGDYNLVFFWRKTGSTKTATYLATPSAVIDNVTVRRNTCLAPYDIKVSALTNDSIGLAWSVSGDKPVSYEVFVTENTALESPDNAQDGDEVFRKEGITDQETGISPLKSSTEYLLFTRTLCEGGHYSDWSDPLAFETACDPKALPATFGFEENEGLHYVHSKSYYIPDCFVQGHDYKPVTSGNYFPYVDKDKNNRHPGRRTGNNDDSNLNALHFTHNSEGNQGGYIVFPLIDADLDTLQLRFWMRAGYEYDDEDINMYARDGSTKDHKSITVGTMSSPSDPSTFVPIAECVYPYSNSDIGSSPAAAADVTGNRYWVEMTVPLKGAQGRYIVMKNDTARGYGYSFVWVDDVIIEPIKECASPYELSVVELTENRAMLSFAHMDGEKWAVHISTREDMADTVRIDTVTDAEAALIADLADNTQYSVRVRQICAEDKSSEWSNVLTFTTYASLRFKEVFDAVRSYPVNWLTSTQDEEYIFRGDEMKHSADGGNWVRVGASEFASAHQKFSFDYHSSKRSWIVTPVISLEGKQDVQLTFDLALTAKDGHYAVPENYQGATDKYFMVVVSDDGGVTWKEENIAGLWANEGFAIYPANHKLDDVPHTGEKTRIDLSEYAGKAIRIGFYAESQNNETMYDIHIDNIQVNTFRNETPAVSICETCDYESDLFSVTSDNLEVGDNVFEILKPSETDEPDVNSTLTLTVKPMPETLFVDSVCAGDTYAQHGFYTKTGGINKLKLPAANECDSVVTLDLKLIQPVYTIVDTTICQGQHVIWNGEKYDRKGVWTDTIERVDCGCDSIVTFVLDVTPAVEYDMEAIICHGDTYLFGDEELDSSGTYSATFETASGCDSIVNLKLTVLPDYRRTIRDVLCAGQKYNKHGFVGVEDAGPHVLPLTSKVGKCDSTVTLYLTILNGDTTYVTDTITTDKLPYEYMDLYYDETTAPGTYRDTIKTDGGEGECESVIIHTLTIENVTFTDDVRTQDLMLTPNPVRVHESVMVHLELTDAEREGLTVHVYNNAGALIQQFEPEGEPITIGGFGATGVYMLRIVDGEGNVYAGKVIVR